MVSQSFAPHKAQTSVMKRIVGINFYILGRLMFSRHDYLLVIHSEYLKTFEQIQIRFLMSTALVIGVKRLNKF